MRSVEVGSLLLATDLGITGLSTLVAVRLADCRKKIYIYLYIEGGDVLCWLH